MPRGGHRENAGRKSGWEHTETTVIRVPQFLANQLLEIARKLDKGESLDSVAESKDSNIGLVVKSESDLVTESIKHVLGAWRVRADAASPKNADWRKSRQILGELEPIVYEGKVLDSVTQSKVHPGQMNLLENESVTEPSESSIETDTDSNTLSNDSVIDSEGWLNTRECWEKLGKPNSYDTFRRLSPEDLHLIYGIQTEPQRRVKGKYKTPWLRLSNSAVLSNQVNPLPEGSERSGEG